MKLALANAIFFPTVCANDMVIDVKAMLQIADSSVKRRLREETPRRDTTMSALVEAGLSYVLAKHASTSE